MKSVVIFDSGIGGFSVLLALLDLHLPIEIIYLADQAYFPYGSKSEQKINDRVSRIGSWAASLSPDLVVTACNSATVTSIENLRSIVTCSVVGVEPVIKPLSNFNNSVILATPITASSTRLESLALSHASTARIYPCDGLATAIESSDDDQVKTILHKIKKDLNDPELEAIGLSCTHYPLIKVELQNTFPGVKIIDPSVAVATRIKNLLNLDSDQSTSPDLQFYTTGQVVRLNEQIKKYLGDGSESVQLTI